MNLIIGVLKFALLYLLLFCYFPPKQGWGGGARTADAESLPLVAVWINYTAALPRNWELYRDIPNRNNNLVNWIHAVSGI